MFGFGGPGSTMSPMQQIMQHLMQNGVGAFHDADRGSSGSASPHGFMVASGAGSGAAHAPAPTMLSQQAGANPQAAGQQLSISPQIQQMMQRVFANRQAQGQSAR